MQNLVRYVERALLAREPTFPQRLALALTRLVRPGVLDTRETLRRHMDEHVRVSVRAYADDDPDEYRRLTVGDWWMRQGVLTALGRAGFVVTDCDPDVVIHLHGRPVELPRRAVAILWIHDNPDRVTPDLLARYRHVFCASERMAARVRALGTPAHALGLATALRPRNTPVRFDTVFVGNARPDGSRPVIEALGPGEFGLRVWGRRYQGLPEGVWMGGYADYHDLPEIYGGSVVSLNDHYPAMVEAGIVSPRVYDILAGGGFCISDANPGLTDVFGDCVPQYRSPGELRSLVRHFLAHPDERLPLMERGRAIALEATWEDRARRLMAPVAGPAR
ncbi:MAG: glycosyltransferase [Vicinamibacteria bacterium]|jgi:hypothetical protein|nr:glycosyltransferase [Vicinamibacteria bacterium]